MVSKRFYLCLIMVCVMLLFLGSYAFSQEVSNPSTESPSDVAVAAEVTPPEVVAANIEAPATEAAAAVMPSINAEAPPAVTPAPAQTPPVTEEAKELKWVWGEVASVDVASNKFVVKFLNYDTDAEETLTVSVDAATRFENADGIAAVKAGDNVGVDYTIDVYSGAIAKSIALEKAESMPATIEEMPKGMVPTPETAPVTQETAPAPQLNAAVEVPVQE